MTSTRVLIALLALGLPLGLIVGCGEDSPEERTDFGPVSGERALANAKAICDFGERQPGSDGIRKVADWITKEVAAIDPKLQVQRHVFTEEREPGVEFQNLYVQIDGKDPENGPIIALAAHYDSKISHTDDDHDFDFIGALDSAASCGLLIELIRELHQNPMDANIWVIWFDGEESFQWDWDPERALYGSRRFAKDMNANQELFPKGLKARMKAFILMDLLGHKQLKIDRDTRSNADLIKIFQETAAGMDMSSVMYGFDSPMEDDHIPFKNLRIPVIDLIDFKGRAPVEHQDPRGKELYKDWDTFWHTADDTIDKASARSLDFVGNLMLQALPKVQGRFVR